MFKHEKLLFHPVGVEQPNRNMQHCFKNSLAAQTISLLNGHDVDASKVPAGEVQTHVFLRPNPGLLNASGYSWTSDYVTVTGDLCADLPPDIASEQRVKLVYEFLYRQIDDKKVKETIDFLLNREEAHNDMFREVFKCVLDTGSNQNFGSTQAAKCISAFRATHPTPVFKIHRLPRPRFVNEFFAKAGCYFAAGFLLL